MVAKAFENWTQKVSRKWPFKNWTVRFSDVDCIELVGYRRLLLPSPFLLTFRLTGMENQFLFWKHFFLENMTRKTKVVKLHLISGEPVSIQMLQTCSVRTLSSFQTTFKYQTKNSGIQQSYLIAASKTWNTNWSPLTLCFRKHWSIWALSNKHL
jgi:hypothetical protein